MFSTVGVPSTVEGVQYREYIDIMSTVVKYLECRGNVQYHGDNMMHVGEYHEYCGRCSVPWGISSFVS